MFQNFGIFSKARVLLDEAAPASGSSQSAGFDPTFIILLVVMVAVFYFLIIRPENKKKKEAEQLRSSLKKGDRITTIGGIVGTIVSIKDDNLVIETSEDLVRMELAKWSVMTNNSAEDAVKAQKEETRAKMKEAEEEKKRLKEEKKAAKKAAKESRKNG